MKKSVSAFTCYLDAIGQHVKKASKLPNPAFGLYMADARTPAFRLEGLARLYARMHNKKYFGKLNKQIKQLEDGLGVIDHYTALEKEFAPHIKVPVGVKEYFAQKATQGSLLLNDVLKEEKWFAGERVRLIKKKLGDIAWLPLQKEVKAITDVYNKEIRSITRFITRSAFDDMENDVHELRRKLRWLSIYAMALQGRVRLVNDEKPVPGYLKKYLTPAIIDSPFNKIEASPDLKRHVKLDKNHFLALSWMIAELGRIKDEGLRVMALAEGFGYTENLKEQDALEKVYTVLAPGTPTLEDLLKRAAGLSRSFIEEGNLERLVL